MNIYEITTILVAALALTLTIYQAYRTRHHDILSVKPLVRIRWNAGETGDGILIANVGLGPAIFRSFSIEKEGKELTIRQLEDRLFEIGIESRILSLAKGHVLNVNEERWIVGARDRLSALKQRQFWNELQGLTICAEFKSLYEVNEPTLCWMCPNPIKYLVRPRTSELPRE